MKINLSDAFDELDLENTDSIPKADMNVPYDNEMTERVKAQVLSKLDTESKNTKSHFKPRRFGRLIAIAAAVAIFAGCISVGAVGAMVYFNPDSSISNYFKYNEEDDLSALGQDINVTQTFGDYEITLTQALSDNQTLYLFFESNLIDGRFPIAQNISVKGADGESLGSYGVAVLNEYVSGEKGSFCVKIELLSAIEASDKIQVFVNTVRLSDGEVSDTDEQDAQMSFSFYVSQADVLQQLDIPDTIVTSDGEYTIKNCRVSPLGFYCDISLPFDEDYDNELFDRVKNAVKSITVEMKNGTVYSVASDHFSGHRGTEATDDEIVGHFDLNFDSYSAVDDIKSITVLDTVIYEAQ